MGHILSIKELTSADFLALSDGENDFFAKCTRRDINKELAKNVIEEADWISTSTLPVLF